MPRRVSLPAADELFRTTGGSAVQPSAPSQQNHSNGEEPSGKEAPGSARVPAPGGGPDAGGPAGSAGEGESASAGDAAVGSGEHSAAGEGEEAGSQASAPSGDSSAENGAEHSGRERGGQDRPVASRHTVPGQGAPSGTGRGRGQDAADGPQRPGAQPAQAAGELRAPAQAQPKAGRTAPEPRSRQAAAGSPRRGGGRGANRRPSGRERHDEKITVYVSAEELIDLEHARLVLRGEHGLAVDRGRIVREAVAVVLADLESRGDASILVRRLRGR